MQLKIAVACSKLNDAPKAHALGSEFVRQLPNGASNKFTSKEVSNLVPRASGRRIKPSEDDNVDTMCA